MTTASNTGKPTGMGRRTGLFLLARAVSAAASLMTIAITTRLLVPSELGQCNLAFSAAALGNSLLFTWVGFVVWRYYPEALQKGGEQAFLHWLLRAGGWCTAGWSLYWLAAMLAMGDVHLPVKLLILPLGLAMGFGEIVQSLLQTQGRVKQSVVLSLALAGSLLLVNGLVLISGLQSAAAYLLASVAVYCAAAAAGMRLCRVQAADSTGADWLRTGEMIRFGFPQTLISICALVLAVGDRFLINMIIGPAGVAVYHSAYALGDLAVQIPLTALTQAAVPMIIATWETAGKEAATAEMHSAMRLMYGFVLPVACMAMAVGPIAGMILLGARYHQALVYIPAVCFGAWLFGITKIINMPFQLEKRPLSLVLLLAVSVVVKLALNLALLPFMGTRGAVVATVISFSLYLLLSVASAGRSFPGIATMWVPSGFKEWVLAGICATYGVMSVCRDFEVVGGFHYIAAAVCLVISGAMLTPRLIRLLQVRRAAALHGV